MLINVLEYVPLFYLINKYLMQIFLHVRRYILQDFENASLYIGYILLKNFLKVERMYKINIVSCTPTR